MSPDCRSAHLLAAPCCHTQHVIGRFKVRCYRKSRRGQRPGGPAHPRLICVHKSRRAVRTSARGSPRRTTPGCWAPRTSSSPGRWVVWDNLNSPLSAWAPVQGRDSRSRLPVPVRRRGLVSAVHSSATECSRQRSHILGQKSLLAGASVGEARAAGSPAATLRQQYGCGAAGATMPPTTAFSVTTRALQRRHPGRGERHLGPSSPTRPGWLFPPLALGAAVGARLASAGGLPGWLRSRTGWSARRRPGCPGSGPRCSGPGR